MRFSLVFLFGLLIISAAFAVNISSCSAPEAVITAPGTYTVNASLSGAPNAGSNGTACILIASDDVILDCQGFSITHDDSAGTSGILLNRTPHPKDNITISNCDIIDYGSAITLENGGPNPEYATLAGNILLSNRHGIYLPGPGLFMLNMSNNLIANNTASGLQDDDYHGDLIQMVGDRFLGNSKDLNYSGESGLRLSFTDIIFGSSGGEYNANVSIEHVMQDRENATIVWVQSPAPPTGQLSGFLGKAFNITHTYLNNYTPDNNFNVTMKWSALEDTAGIQMWLMNDSGAFLLNDSPSGYSLFSSVNLTNGSRSTVIALFAPSYEISDCRMITNPGEYDVVADLTGAPLYVRTGLAPGLNDYNLTACIHINTSDVVLDCDGYSITNDMPGTPRNYTSGIYAGSAYAVVWDNITVRNCYAARYSSG
ncbi:MAG: hypothetical protein ACOY58_01915, partial [Candidatus Micrarchaeota archaeon]